MGRAGSQLRSSKVPAEDSTAAAPVMMARYVSAPTLAVTMDAERWKKRW